MKRFWIQYELGRSHGVRTVDISEGDLLAGFDPIDTMWHELSQDIGPLMDGVERGASVLRREILEGVAWGAA